MGEYAMGDTIDNDKNSSECVGKMTVSKVALFAH